MSPCCGVLSYLFNRSRTIFPFLFRLFAYCGVISLALLVAVPRRVEAVFAYELGERTKGQILLDVERNGEAWYVDPASATRTYLGRPDDAFRIMREHSVGITNADLARIPVVGEQGVGDQAMRDRTAGRILLQVERNGEAWYVDPVAKVRHYLGRPADAFRIMSEFGTGITSENLVRIPVQLAPSVDRSSLPSSVRLEVPFISQAPLGEWGNETFQEGCEEAIVLMAMRWLRGEGEPVPASVARADLLHVTAWQKDRNRYQPDLSIADTAALLHAFDSLSPEVHVQPLQNENAVRAELAAGHLVALPIDGRLLPFPFYVPPGPPYHVLVVRGYDADGTFLVHEPGAVTKGEDFRVAGDVLFNSIRDYPTGYHEYVPSVEKLMLVVRPLGSR